jgi:hypothetical protein
MAFVRTLKRGKRIYYYLVEGIREGAKVRQKHLRYMGTVKPSPEAVQKALGEIRAKGRE